MSRTLKIVLTFLVLSLLSASVQCGCTQDIKGVTAFPNQPDFIQKPKLPVISESKISNFQKSTAASAPPNQSDLIQKPKVLDETKKCVCVEESTLAALTHQSACTHKAKVPDYYWRIYNGQVPEDAVPACLPECTQSSSHVFIGQAYLRDKKAIIPVQITRGQKNIIAPFYGIQKAEDEIKILCSKDIFQFSWIPSEKNLHLTGISQHFVVGGVENKHRLFIGRKLGISEMIIGKVLDYNTVGESKLYLPNNGKEVLYDSYDILVYSEIVIDVRSNLI